MYSFLFVAGASRPKVFYDGCTAKYNNTHVTVVGQHTESSTGSASSGSSSNGSSSGSSGSSSGSSSSSSGALVVVPAHHVSVGDLVEALYHGHHNGTRWYKQTVVTHVHEDGTVDLRYHDDDTEKKVAPQFIKINGENK